MALFEWCTSNAAGNLGRLEKIGKILSKSPIIIHPSLYAMYLELESQFEDL